MMRHGLCGKSCRSQQKPLNDSRTDEPMDRTCVEQWLVGL